MPNHAATGNGAIRAASVERISGFVHRQSGMLFGPEKAYLMETRLAPVAARHGYPSLDAFADRLVEGCPQPLAREVVEAMTISETSFFRDNTPFAGLARTILPALVGARWPGSRMRFWSAACASGQEAWSLAMTAAEEVAALRGRVVSILATDISEGLLQRARSGVYAEREVARGMPQALRDRYLTPDGPDRWRIADALRPMVSFACENILAPLPLRYGTFEVIFCRNVLIYFDIATKQRVLGLLAERLAPDGVLFMGAAETPVGLSTAYRPHPSVRGAFLLA